MTIIQYENVEGYKYHREFQLYGRKKIRKVKPTKIESILIPAHKLQELNRFLSSKNDSQAKKRIMIKKIAGGSCHGCSGIPTKKLTFDMKGASVVGYYCDSCFEKI